MLAGELGLMGVRPLVLERQPRLLQTPKANGFNGQIVELLRYRGLLARVEEASGRPVGPAPGAPFGGLQLDFSHLADPPMRAVHLPQPRLERLLGEHARDLGADIRRGHEVAGVSQRRRGGDRGRARPRRAVPGDRPVPSGLRRRAQPGPCYGRDPVPGTTYPEVNRLAQVTVPDSVTGLGNGDLDVPGLGRIRRASPAPTAVCSGSGPSPRATCSSRRPRTRPPESTTTRR